MHNGNMLMFKFYFMSMLILIESTEWIELPKMQATNKIKFNDYSNKIMRYTEDNNTEENVTNIKNIEEQTNLNNTKFREQDQTGNNESNTFFHFENKLNPNLQKILIKVHQALAKEADKSVIGKLQYLQQLNNKFLHHIKKITKRLWINTDGRGHAMEFPSLEGALLTISFLTFAVFLIKIVQKFIQNLQSGNGIIQLPTTPAPALIIRHKRNTDKYGMDIRILHYIDEFKMNHNIG